MAKDVETMDQSTTPTANEPEVAAGKLAGNRDKRAKAPGRPPVAKRVSKRAAPTSRTYSEAERAQMMASIANTVKESRCTFKEAIKAAGISEQTYYQWKKAKITVASVEAESDMRSPLETAPTSVAKRVSEGPAVKIDVSTVPGDNLDIAQLQRENQRLRQIFAEKLMAANDELRKKIATL